ncbi:MAG: DUF4038 domain-containing protein [Bacteroidetes bacterium]|nr:MAG: DUF4038 domain-containing protein [Bacteroidota bacterium]
MKRIFIAALFQACILCAGYAQPLAVSKNGRFLTAQGGEPFFWLGDTGWELFHRLDREEALCYLENRAEKGFNLVQAVALHELEAFESPNVYGDFPLKGRDILIPDTTAGSDPGDPEQYDYWDHVEFIIREAAGLGIITGLLPCWGEYVTPRFRDRTIGTVEQGYAFGWFVGKRFSAWNDHIVWILGGDRLPDERPYGVEIWRAMAEGITDGVTGRYGHDGKARYESTFMTYHCYPSSARWFHSDPWIDMHTWGSYHEKKDNERAFFEAQDDWDLPDPKPTLNSEPPYELHPVNYNHSDPDPERFDDFDVRQQAYWSVFAGTCGHTYGCHPVWQMYRKENPHPPLTLYTTGEWHEALDEPGAVQVGYLKKLILSRDFNSRRPDQSILAENTHDPAGHLQACSGKDFWMVYIPTGKEVKLYLGRTGKERVAFSWFDPRNGTFSGSREVAAEEVTSFDPPGEPARGNDWVLVVDF